LNLKGSEKQFKELTDPRSGNTGASFFTVSAKDRGNFYLVETARHWNLGAELLARTGCCWRKGTGG